MYAIDGNSSLKRVVIGSREAADTRILNDSTYFLSNEYVNRFANEVRGRRTKNRTVRKRTADDSSDDEDLPSDAESEEGDPTDGLKEPCEQVEPNTDTPSTAASTSSTLPTAAVRLPTAQDLLRIKQLEHCVKNWKAASSEEKKKMWAIFDESGIFASVCRHGLVLWIADMVRSGEL